MVLDKKKPIVVQEQKVVVEGSVFYNDSRRRIDLKKPIRDLFNNSKKKVAYKMELCLSSKSTISRVEELIEKNVRPVLLYFEVEENE